MTQWPETYTRIAKYNFVICHFSPEFCTYIVGNATVGAGIVGVQVYHFLGNPTTFCCTQVQPSNSNYPIRRRT